LPSERDKATGNVHIPAEQASSQQQKLRKFALDHQSNFDLFKGQPEAAPPT
jgi:hypothetical protein